MKTLRIYYESELAIVRESTLDDCYEVARRMRKQDIDEVWSSNHLSPSEATLACFKKSTITLTVERKGFAVAMFGIVPDNLVGGFASIWLLSTDGIVGIDKSFVRNSHMFIRYFLNFYSVLHSYVDMRNTVSIKWLKWLGANFSAAAPYGLDQMPCMYFEFKKDSV